mmetsp:Transcript_14755/g.42296  ORF Transcript_14755/g.42296 Transcript_14755/m.42296 type:complete len:205 (-) Transcript_14755:84-698(-)
MMKVLSAACLLSSSLCLGLTVERDPSACPCMKWSEAYGFGGVNCFPGLGGLAGGEFCNFMKGLRSDVCVHKDFNARLGVTESVCYVSGQCAGRLRPQLKTCKKGKDSLLTEMPVAETTSLAKQNSVDQGCMAGYGSVYVDKLISELSEQELEQYKASNLPIFIWSMRDHLGPRLQIKGHEVYRHTFDRKAPGFWKVTCEEGCSK